MVEVVVKKSNEEMDMQLQIVPNAMKVRLRIMGKEEGSP